MFTGGGFVFALAPIFFGGTLVILPKFDPEHALRIIDNERITNTNVAPVHIDRILKLEAKLRARYGLDSLVALVVGGAPFPANIKEQAVEFFGSGVLHELYGSTEGGIFTNLRPADQLRKPGSVGLPFPCTEVGLFDESGQEVEAGQPGQFFSRSPFHFLEYWNNAAATRELFRGEWLSVGDIATRDEEGFVSLIGRKSDLIITGGYNVHPGEVEEVLESHASVREAVVIGAPDPEWGEAVTAFVVLKNGISIDEAALSAHCRQTLSRYKAPKRYVAIDQLPRDPAMGKIQRKRLRAMLDAEATDS
jgi:long-chain acyl-CoA synthetase